MTDNIVTLNFKVKEKGYHNKPLTKEQKANNKKNQGHVQWLSI